MVENDRGEYLLQQRKNTGYLDGYYDISGSGHLEYGESIEHCGVRELQEEVGLVVKEEDLELVAVFQSDFEAGVRYINVIYKSAKYTGNLVNGEPTKIDDLCWFAPRTMPAKLTVAARVFLRALKERTTRNYYIGSAEYEALMGAPYGSS
jgi:8-oxo-dGTP pyrophosphatase MutT (NUDIX family)